MIQHQRAAFVIFKRNSPQTAKFKITLEVSHVMVVNHLTFSQLSAALGYYTSLLIAKLP